MKKVRFSTKKLAYVEKKQRMFVEKSVDFTWKFVEKSVEIYWKFVEKSVSLQP